MATGYNAIFNLPIHTEIALWLLMAAAGITVIQRMIIVRRQAVSP